MINDDAGVSVPPPPTTTDVQVPGGRRTLVRALVWFRHLVEQHLGLGGASPAFRPLLLADGPLRFEPSPSFTVVLPEKPDVEPLPDLSSRAAGDRPSSRTSTLSPGERVSCSTPPTCFLGDGRPSLRPSPPDVPPSSASPHPSVRRSFLPLPSSPPKPLDGTPFLPQLSLPFSLARTLVHNRLLSKALSFGRGRATPQSKDGRTTERRGEETTPAGARTTGPPSPFFPSEGTKRRNATA